MRKTPAVVASVSGLVALAAVAAWVLAAADPQPLDSAESPPAKQVAAAVTPVDDDRRSLEQEQLATAAPSGQPGIKAFLDPETGELRARPRPGDEDLGASGSAPTMDEWINTYGKDLIEQPLEQGGYVVDLRGRFRTALRVKIDEESGEVSGDCVTETVEVEASGGDDGDR